MRLKRVKHRRISVVLADDQQEVRRALRRSMDRDGRFDVVAEAQTGAEAVGAVAEFRPDALILDLAMPDLDGLAALPQIRSASPDTKVLILSSMVPFGAGEEALTAGAAAAFDKYTSPKRLIARVIAETSSSVPRVAETGS